MERIEKFKMFLSKRGAEILSPTNEWEVLRFKTINGVSVVYKNKYGALTFTGESAQAHKAYLNNSRWTAVKKRKQVDRTTKEMVATRDGARCFCCLEVLPITDLTMEHFLSVKHGGTNNINNLALLCQPCNLELGAKPIVKKIAIIIRKRAEEGDDFVPMTDKKIVTGGVHKIRSLRELFKHR